MDEGSWYSGYGGCIVGSTRPTDINVIVGTRSMVGRGQYSDYERVNRGMSGTCSMMVDCQWYYSHNWMMCMVHYAMEGYEAGTHSTVVYI